MYFHPSWIYTIKEMDSKIIRKSKLVAKRFEEECLDEIQKTIPTCEKKISLILSIIALRKWEIHAVDFKASFLQGEAVQREVLCLATKRGKCG